MGEELDLNKSSGGFVEIVQDLGKEGDGGISEIIGEIFAVTYADNQGVGIPYRGADDYFIYNREFKYIDEEKICEFHLYDTVEGSHLIMFDDQRDKEGLENV